MRLLEEGIVQLAYHRSPNQEGNAKKSQPERGTANLHTKFVAQHSPHYFQ
jgi:hypothetical protein